MYCNTATVVMMHTKLYAGTAGSVSHSPSHLVHPVSLQPVTRHHNTPQQPVVLGLGNLGALLVKCIFSRWTLLY